MQDDSWNQDANPANAPGVSRRQIFEFVKKLARDKEFYDRYKEAEMDRDREQALAGLLRESGINVQSRHLSTFNLPKRSELLKYVEAYEANPAVWVGIPNEPLPLPPFSNFCFKP